MEEAMPKEFTDCVKNGGKVVTKKLKNGKYIRICYDKKGNSHAGEVMKKKTEKFESTKKKPNLENSKKLAESLVDLQRYFNENYKA
jgi:putative hemolysin